MIVTPMSDLLQEL